MTSLDIHSQIETLRMAGTGQLRKIAKLWKIRGASKLKRDDLIFSIIGKQQGDTRQLELKDVK